MSDPHLLCMDGYAPDLGVRVSTELVKIRQTFREADQVYCLYREKLLNEEGNQSRLKLTEWTPPF